MAYDYYDVLHSAQRWAESAIHSGHLSSLLAQALLDLEQNAPPNLFTNNDNHTTKLLLIAFMGGTGVGKSSLLNRLAGQAIAKAGVSRPTSREVTLYYHQSLDIQQLPAGLPLNSIKLSPHDNAAQRQLIWMDMPDFDSVELANHLQVRHWLPYIDVLLYIVSPERYRDNKAWQLLLSEGAKHAWLFVMNQWDRGQIAQYEDFKQQLHKASFRDPLIYRTSCSEPTGDEFSQLVAQLQNLSQQQSLIQLEQHKQDWQTNQLKSVLLQLQTELKQRDYTQLEIFLDEVWAKAESAFLAGLQWPLQNLAKAWIEPAKPKSEIKLWDEWAQSRFEDCLDELILQSAQLDLPTKPLKLRLLNIKTKAEKKVKQQTELSTRAALLNPGNGLQRFLLKLTAISETVLPMAAMSVVAYLVYSSYYQSSQENSAYLGVDFAIHSSLLIALSWLIPFFLHKKLQPSLEKTALRGLQTGLQNALRGLHADILNSIVAEQASNKELGEELEALLSRIEVQTTPKLRQDSLLERVLINTNDLG
jgi:GTPase SAR1 family protein